MKPAPFKNFTYTDAVTKFKVSSILGKDNDGFGDSGSTEIFSPEGKPLWTFGKFIGRRVVDLSPDGKTLILSGDFYYGYALNVSRDEVMATVIKEGSETQTITFSQLFAASAKEIAKTKRFEVRGGGWGQRSDFLKGPIVDWKAKNLKFHLYDDVVKEFSF